MEKLLYHLVSGQTHTWSETGRVKQFLKVAKKKVIEHIRKLGFLIDTQTSGGGNTDTGGIVDRFFSRESRKDICDLILKETDRIAYCPLLELYSMVLSVCQSVDASRRVVPEKVQILCTELMVFEKTHFPFAMLSPSVHSMCTILSCSPSLKVLPLQFIQNRAVKPGTNISDHTNLDQLRELDKHQFKRTYWTFSTGS